jgi:hypothetical protein
MFFIQKGDELLFGYMDKSGKTVIEPKYSLGETFRSDGTALVQYKGNWGKLIQWEMCWSPSNMEV